jgi:hypothetical protein
MNYISFNETTNKETNMDPLNLILDQLHEELEMLLNEGDAQKALLVLNDIQMFQMTADEVFEESPYLFA